MATTLEIGLAQEADSAETVAPVRVLSLTQAIESDEAFIVDWEKVVHLGLAEELDTSVTLPEATVILPEGMQFTLPENRIHFTLPNSRLHLVKRWRN